MLGLIVSDMGAALRFCRLLGLDRSLSGGADSVVVPDLGNFDISVEDSMLEPTRTALANLYNGLDHPIETQTTLALAASSEAHALSKADTTTVVVMSEFGRRVEQNDSAGADHGHGGLAMVHGRWRARWRLRPLGWPLRTGSRPG